MDNLIIDGVKGRIPKSKSEIVSLTSKLIQFPTVSPPSETKECAAFIRSYFDEIGVETTVYERKKDKTNICVRVPGRPDTKVLWLGHIDVVPEGLPEKWMHNPYGGEVADGRIYGRGSSDMKGSCAAAMVAAKILSEMDEEAHAAVELWFTCDEEVGSQDGTRWLTQEGMIHGDVCVIGDFFGETPMHPWIDAGCKGYMRTRLKATGKAAHGSLPFLGDNAIDRLILAIEKARQIGRLTLEIPEDLNPIIESSIKFLLRMKGLTEDQMDAVKGIFHHPTASLNLIKGGERVNIVPDYAEATFDIRVTPGVDIRKVEHRMFILLKGFKVKGVEVETVEMEGGYYERMDSTFARSLVRAVELATGTKPLPKILLGTTEGIYLERLVGIPSLGFGAGIEGTAHMADEYVTIENLLMAAEVYTIFPIIYKKDKP